jgi:DNA (cytosine-5)-methyltransferase 1
MDSLSLFTGVGGFDLGFGRSGIETVAMCEADKVARGVLAHHWPGVNIFEDVKDIDGKEYKSVDIIHGGFPCQDISFAGKREGLAGERSGLWWEFYRVICEAMPRWIVIENVAGLLSSGGRRDLGAIIGALGELGYMGGYRVLDARYFGVAQRRRRVFIVASLGNDCGQKVLFDSESLPGNFDESGQEGKKTSTGSKGGNGVGGLLAETGVVGSLTKALGGAGADAAHAQNGWLIPERIGNLSTHFNSKNYSNLQEVLAGSVFPAADEGELAVRRLTPVECERLMGFPDNWTQFKADGKKVSDSARYRFCGNAVVVNTAEWLGARISTFNK